MIHVLSSFDEYLCAIPASLPTTPLVPGQYLLSTQGTDAGHVALVGSASRLEMASQTNEAPVSPKQVHDT